MPAQTAFDSDAQAQISLADLPILPPTIKFSAPASIVVPELVTEHVYALAPTSPGRVRESSFAREAGRKQALGLKNLHLAKALRPTLMKSPVRPTPECV